MPSKNDRVIDSFQRAHNDLFSGDRYLAEFINITRGLRDNAKDEFTNETVNYLGKIPVEVIPPAIDATIRGTGTSVSWDTSIRFPVEDKPGNLKPLGEDNQKPTEVIITDPEESAESESGINYTETYTQNYAEGTLEDGKDVYELHGYSYEKGSGMLMCRLVEK